MINVIYTIIMLGLSWLAFEVNVPYDNTAKQIGIVLYFIGMLGWWSSVQATRWRGKFWEKFTEYGGRIYWAATAMIVISFFLLYF